jgi:hypothetical protein
MFNFPEICVLNCCCFINGEPTRHPVYPCDDCRQVIMESVIRYGREQSLIHEFRYPGNICLVQFASQYSERIFLNGLFGIIPSLSVQYSFFSLLRKYMSI